VLHGSAYVHLCRPKLSEDDLVNLLILYWIINMCIWVILCMLVATMSACQNLLSALLVLHNQITNHLPSVFHLNNVHTIESSTKPGILLSYAAALDLAIASALET